jgi:hypothetical protein
MSDPTKWVQRETDGADPCRRPSCRRRQHAGPLSRMTGGHRSGPTSAVRRARARGRAARPVRTHATGAPRNRGISGALAALRHLRLSSAPWKNPSAWEHKAGVHMHLGRDEQSPAYKRLILTHHKHLNCGDFSSATARVATGRQVRGRSHPLRIGRPRGLVIHDRAPPRATVTFVVGVTAPVAQGHG